MNKVLGISGSLYKTSNTDTLIKTIMEATGADYELINLSNVKVAHCIECKKCVQTNECVKDDDFKWISKKVLDADAIVIGSPVKTMSVNSITLAFMERLSSLTHEEPTLLRGKLAAGVAIGWLKVNQVNEWLTILLQAAGMEVMGTITFQGTPESFLCGKGETCPRSSWNIGKKLEITTGQDTGIEKLCEGYIEELPDNDPFTNPSYKIISLMYQ